MIQNTDLLEIRKQFKKETCHIQRMAGVYVAYDSGEKKVKCRFNKTFLNLEDDEFYKYLDLAKKSLSGKLGDAILELSFKNSDTKKALAGMISSELKDENLIEAMAEKIISDYDYLGNYLILFYYDVYDIPVKTTDKQKLDESEEVFPYIICSICPMTLSKPGLGYRKEDDSIGTLERDWILGLPENAFMYPSFSERSADTDCVTYMTKDKKNPHGQAMFEILGTKEKQTVKEQQTILVEAIADYVEPEELKEVADEVQLALAEYVEETPNPILNEVSLKEVFEKTEVPKDTASLISSAVADRICISEEPVNVSNLVDEKAVARIMLEPLMEPSIIDKNTVHISVSAEKKSDVNIQNIDGVEYVMIPVNEGEKVRLNGTLL